MKDETPKEYEGQQPHTIPTVSSRRVDKCARTPELHPTATRGESTADSASVEMKQKEVTRDFLGVGKAAAALSWTTVGWIQKSAGRRSGSPKLRFV